MRELVLGDLHGNYLGLMDCFKRSKFDYKKDKLIVLGDVCDGYPDTKKVIDELLKVKNLVMIFGNHDCLSEDTECLTKRGWLHYSQITLSDEIYSFNIEKNKGVWSKINDIIIKPCNEKILKSLVTNYVDLLCTNNHRVLSSKRVGTGFKPYKYTRMKDLSGRVKIPVTSRLELEDYPISDNELKFVAWVLTDGGVRKGEKSHTPQYSVYQSKKKNIKSIRQLLKDLKYDFSEYIMDRNIKSICGKSLKQKPLPQVQFALKNESNKKVFSYFKGKYPFPNWLKSLSTRQFHLFLKYLIKGDGSFYKHTDNAYILYGGKIFLDNIQILCLLNGYRAVIAKDNRGTYRLNISKYDSAQLDTYGKIQSIKYSKNVWCLSVPLTNFMVRRNGKAFFTGNSWLLDYFTTTAKPKLWLGQGGQATVESYAEGVPESHRKFLRKALPYYIDEQNRVFVHGGFYPFEAIEKEDRRELLWNRELWHRAMNNPVELYHEVYIGHTSIWAISKVPMCRNNVWNLDTGGGYEGRISLMDINTKEFWQSENSSTYYKTHNGRPLLI